VSRATILVLLIASIHCGSPLPPSSNAVGDWSGQLAPSHFDYLWLRITQQQENRLEGISCYTNGAHRAFGGVPVAIDYPSVSVSEPNNFLFVGGATDRKTPASPAVQTADDVTSSDLGQ
jgi:hypothetical protein